MFVEDSGRIFVNVHHPAYHFLADFLVSCCEPVSRTSHINEYRLDAASLSAASVEGTYTPDIIANILRYFRLDDDRELPICLQKLNQLREECIAGKENRLRTTTPPLESGRPVSLQYVASEDRECRGTSDTATKVAGEMVEAHPNAAEYDSGQVISQKIRLSLKRSRDTGSMDVEAKQETLQTTLEAAASSPVSSLASPGRLKLVLRKAAPSEEDRGQERGAESTAQASQLGVSLPADGGVAGVEASSPLVHRAVVKPSAIRPLPSNIQKLLRSEENASRLRIVLQPKSLATPHSARKVPAESQLAYFLVSTDRSHLEFIVSHMREYVQPVTLRGVERWVISDVDRGVEEKVFRGNSRGALLRALYGVGGEKRAAGAGLGRRGASMGYRQPSRLVYKAMILTGKLRNVRERLFKQLGIRADCFYDYKLDRSCAALGLTLREGVRLRPYQVASLERFRQGDKAHQGVVVLPCGAGKTLTGIAAACTVGKRTIVMCINVMSVLQWRAEFLRWTNLKEEQVTVCIADKKQIPGDVFITTYTMLVAKRPTRLTAAEQVAMSEDARMTEQIMETIQSAPWGLLILDEVHTALAHHFQEVMNKVKHHCALGLSATLLREDERIDDLQHLVGPKLFEANWLELTRQGFLATVECAEVQCPLPPPFFKSYLSSICAEDRGESRRLRVGTSSLARAITCINPTKLWCAQALLEFHENRTPPDKVIIFCDYLEGVRYYAHYLGVPFMDGRTSEEERNNLLQYFQFSKHVNAILLSRVGDTALDLPNASVIIQITGLGASRRQEAQRLGRILRPKPPSLDNTCSYFYTLVTQDSHEVKQSYGRQSWLRDQGIAYRILSAETVLSEFSRLGGVRCCVGAPQWWYEASAQEADEFRRFHDGVQGASWECHPTHSVVSPFSQQLGLSEDSPQRRSPHNRRDELARVWIPLSVAGSRKIQQHFLRGDDEAVIDSEDPWDTETREPYQKRTGRDNLRNTAKTSAQLVEMLSGSHPVRPTEPKQWRVEFSSSNVPETFGVIKMGAREAHDVELDDSQPCEERVRRVCFGQPEGHRCDAEAACFAYALQSVSSYGRAVA